MIKTKLTPEDIANLQKHEHKKRRGDFYSEKLSQGMYSTSMLFGAANVLRKLNGLSPYKSFYGVKASLRDAGLKPVVIGRMAWWNAEEAIAILTTKANRGAEASLDHGLPVTREEWTNGEWQDLARCARITGLTKRRITRFGNNHPEHVRVTPKGNRLFHLDSLREWGDYRQPQWIGERFGFDILRGLEQTRKKKTWPIPNMGDKKGTLIYVPEFSHL